MTQDPDVYHQVLLVLRRIIHALDRNSWHLKKHHGLTVPQLILLQEVARLKVVPVGDLAKRVRLSNGTVTGILNRLSKRELVQRTRSTEDRRRVLVKITNRGAKILQNAPSVMEEHFVTAFARLQNWEQTQILSWLQRTASMMEFSS